MTPSQLRRLTKPALMARVQDLEDDLLVAQQTLAEPIEPAEAFSSLIVRVRNDGAGIILLVIEAGQTTFLMGRKARHLLNEALVSAGWGCGWK